MALSIVVVFVTAYALIMPAVTLDTQEAQKQGGIDVTESVEPVESAEPAEMDAQETGTDEATGGEDAAREQDIEAEDAVQSGELSFEGKGYGVTASFDEKAGLPLDAELTASEIKKDDEDYQAWYDETLKALQEEQDGEQIGELKLAKFYDISFLSQDGEVEPKAPVDVTISYDKALAISDADSLRIVHFAADRKGKLKPEVLDEKVVDATVKKGKLTEAGFKAESFSVYGVVTTEPEAVPADGLDGKTAKISKNGQYILNRTTGSNPTLIAKGNESQAANWTFVAAGDLKYYITDGRGQYINITRHDDNSANITITRTPQPMKVIRYKDGTYSINADSERRTYYINWWDNGNGAGFGGWAYYDGGATLTFTFTGDTPPAETEGKYVVVVHHGEEYYAVQNDGSLVPVVYDAANNRVTMDLPLVWDYVSVPGKAGFSDLRIAAEAAKFDGNQLPTKYAYRYIDPNKDSGISEEAIRSQTDVDDLSGSCALQYDQNLHVIHGEGEGTYLGVKETNGKLKITGKNDQSEAAEILFATIGSVPEPYGTGNTVNHIDISVQGTVDINIPLAYGTYYYYDDDHQIQTLTVSADHPVISKAYQVPVAIKKEDMMKADITAYKKDENGNETELDNMFYVTGYSANGAEGVGQDEADQVRIEGSFKVSYTDVPGVNGNETSRQARMSTPVYYTVSAPKEVDVPLKYSYTDEQDRQHSYPLYAYNPEETGEDPLTTKTTVTLSASFNYWDFENNECPAAVNSLGGNWRAGDIPDGLDSDKYHSGSGMDFKLGGSSTAQAKVYAVEITKIVVDENGNRIKSDNAGTNTFHLYRKGPGAGGSDPTMAQLADEVKDLAVGAAPEDPVNYNNYDSQHDKEVAVGEDGLGMVYDYDVSPGLYYIKEDPSSIQDHITDTSGQTWDYKESYFLTEYAWRNHENDNKMHVSGTSNQASDAYSSIPEILGDHPGYSDGRTYTNDFLEFYVYNVYESPKVDVPVNKTWPDFDGEDSEDYDWEASFKLQWAPLYPDESTPNEAFQDVRPEQTITITKDQMKDEEAQEASLEDRTFKDLPKYGTDRNGNTFRYQYSLEETSYRVYNKTTGVVLYTWDEENGYNTEDEDTHYHPFYPHDAGEESDEDEDYHIDVRNAKRNISEKEYIDVSLSKQWDSSFENLDENRWAEFELKRFVHTEYRDISHMTDSDRGADPITVTVKDGSGNIVDSLEVLPNVGLYLGGNFKPHDEAKSVTFTSDSPVTLPSGSHVSSITATAEGSNQSNALVRSGEFFVTHDTTFTITSGAENLISGGKIARILDTAAGTNPRPDRSFSRTIRLESSNNWHADLSDLIRSVTSAGDDDGNENVTYYEYYFVEKDGSPKGYARYFRANTEGQPTEILSGDMDHQIEEDDSIVAVNEKPNKLIVKKLWRGVPDNTGFPGVKFTLYQAWEDENEGWVYENETTHTRYEHIELKGNSLEWVCPEVLPVTKRDGDRSRRVKYYVMEDERAGSASDGGITTSWEFYYYRTSKGQQTNAGSQGYFAALKGEDLANEGGTITICNRMGQYTDLDIKKQFFTLLPAGAWDNTTSSITREAVLGFKVIRAIKTSDGKYLDESGKVSETPVWMDYSDEMLCGYDANGDPVVSNGPDNLFYLKYFGLWHFEIMNNWGDQTDVDAADSGSGLPTYGFFIKNGRDIPVEYDYSFREVNVYKDLDRTPYPDWDWFSSITPVLGYGPKGSFKAFPSLFEGQDPDHVVNFQASDLIIDKEWVGDPTATEVYIKVWRTSGDGEPEDFTKIIAEDVRNNNNWQMYMTDPSQVDLQRNCLILKPDSDGRWEDRLKVNRALLGSLAQTGEYHYYIQEIGYKTESGEYRTNVNSKYKPKYDKWVDGRWTGAPVGMNSYAGNNIKIGAKGENRLKVINQSVPSTSYTVTKAFHGPQSSTGGQSTVTGKYPTDGSGHVVVELQQRYRYEKTEGGVDYVSADNENWVRADSDEAKNTWTVDWQGAESADPTSVVLPLKKPAGSTLTDEAWYGSSAAWTYTWEGLDLEKVIAEDANQQNTRKARLYYRAVEVSTPGWFNSVIAAEEQDGHKAIDDDDQTAAQRLAEKNTVTNERNDCDLELNKEWTGLGQGETWPDGYTIDYQLIQHFHLALADMSHQETGEDGRNHITPVYTTSKTFKSVDMTTQNAGAATADSVHPQVIGRNIGKPAEGSVIADITGLPIYGFLTATAEDVAEAAKAGVTLKEGVVYPVVYTYSAKETAVKKNGTDVDFRPQTVKAEQVEGDTTGKEYTATLTNELTSVTIEKEWNGLTPGASESATIKLLRFEKEPEATTFMYTVTVTGSAEALASDGTVTAAIYNSTGEEAGRYELKKNDWSHDFELPVGETYHAVFLGDGEVLETAVTPDRMDGISNEGSVEVQAAVKPQEIPTGSVKLVVSGSPNNLWVADLHQYEDANGEPVQGYQAAWSKGWFGADTGETEPITGLEAGKIYGFYVGDDPSTVSGAEIMQKGNAFVYFTATSDLTTIELNYAGGGAEGYATFNGTNLPAEQIAGQWGSFWDNRNRLTIGQEYEYWIQVQNIGTFSTHMEEVTGATYRIGATNDYTSGGQIQMFITPTDSVVNINLSFPSRAQASSRALKAAPKSAKAAPLRAPASITWTNNTEGLPAGANPETDYRVDTVTFPGSNNTWSKTWNELPKYSSNGKEYVYYAYETDWNGAAGATALETTYSIGEDGTLVVTNTPTLPDLGNLKVTKEVFYGDALNTQATGMNFTVGIFTDQEGTQRAKDADNRDIEDQVITVNEGTGEAIFTGLAARTYYVYEIDANGNPVTGTGAAATITADGKEYTVTYFGNPATVTNGQTAEMSIRNTKAPFDLNLVKIEKDKLAVALNGAEFTLNKLVESGTGESRTISYDPAFAERTAVTATVSGNAGRASFNDLPLGYYEINETKAPAGYILNGDTIFWIKVTSTGIQRVVRDDGKPMDEWETAGTVADDPVTFTASNETFTATIANTPGVELPSSGGPGTTWIYLIGVILLLGCGSALVARRRAKAGR